MTALERIGEVAEQVSAPFRGARQRLAARVIIGTGGIASAEFTGVRGARKAAIAGIGVRSRETQRRVGDAEIGDVEFDALRAHLGDIAERREIGGKAVVVERRLDLVKDEARLDIIVDVLPEARRAYRQRVVEEKRAEAEFIRVGFFGVGRNRLAAERGRADDLRNAGLLAMLVCCIERMVVGDLVGQPRFDRRQRRRIFLRRRPLIECSDARGADRLCGAHLRALEGGKPAIGRDAEIFLRDEIGERELRRAVGARECACGIAVEAVELDIVDRGRVEFGAEAVRQNPRLRPALPFLAREAQTRAHRQPVGRVPDQAGIGGIGFIFEPFLALRDQPVDRIEQQRAAR